MTPRDASRVTSGLATTPDALAHLGHLYRATRDPAPLVVPPLQCLMLDGVGDPGTSADFAGVVGALYAVSYTVKFTVKSAGGPQWRIAPLEGLWQVENPVSGPGADRDMWGWTLLIVQPDAITATMVEDAVRTAEGKGKLTGGRRPRLGMLDEGEAWQVMHVGPYATEGATIAALHAAITEHGLVARGRHHEIYLGDPRRSAPDRLRTILRQPVSRG